HGVRNLQLRVGSEREGRSSVKRRQKRVCRGERIPECGWYRTVQAALSYTSAERPSNSWILGFLHKGIVVVREHSERPADDRSRLNRVGETQPRLKCIEATILRIKVGAPNVRERERRRVRVGGRGWLDEWNRYQKTRLDDLIDGRLVIQTSSGRDGTVRIPA